MERSEFAASPTLRERAKQRHDNKKEEYCEPCRKLRQVLRRLGPKNDSVLSRFSQSQEISDVSRPPDVFRDSDMLNEQEGTSATVYLSISVNWCRSCLNMAQMLKGIECERQIISFEAFARNNVQILKAGLGNGITLCLEPANSGGSYLTEVYPQHLSMEFSLKSLRDCIQNHERTCSWSTNMPNIMATVSTYLIDLETKSLVRRYTSEKYTALSYVWAHHDSDQSKSDLIQCSSSMLPTMQEHNFFSFTNSKIPQIVRQAMLFTASMGLRYLWVDRFCIPQDDAEEKHSQLQSMGAIYHYAHFVIIAAEGDGGDGLRTEHMNHQGLQIDAQLNDKYRVFNGALDALMGITYEPVIEDTLWARRGWTFQEGMFARRSFVFRGGITTFQCRKSVWQEGIVRSIPHHDKAYGTSSSTTYIAVPKWPNMLYFKSILEVYMRRELTYPCDSLDALGGLLNVLKPSFPGGFLFGIPEVCFDIGLLWQPQDIVLDRLALARDEGKPVADLPSWSWARWKGALDFTAWEAAAESLFQSYYLQNFLLVSKIVEWRKVSVSGIPSLISDVYSQYRELASNDSQESPNGWRRQTLPYGIGKDSSLSRLLKSTNHKFTHSSLGEQYPFRFPIPLPSNRISTEANQNWTSKILGNVERTFLYIYPRKLPSRTQTAWFSIQKKAPSGESMQVGVVQLHDPFFDSESDIAIRGEFIAISAGAFLGVPGQSVSVPWTMLHEWELAQRTNNSNVYEFYNVMFVERCNDIVLRKGLGRVQKALWEGLEREKIEVLLG
ncbi:HET-domain-containing protein [Periconia macrospinosa]|uniref:HET-domain-containing protein n=1 Tax=Periconia macrospinosa TaxID=97972 RepID=A0A2V1E5L8_9PLEO|nr:HET-domain-containing protein [Periconia macrospinosa]